MFSGSYAGERFNGFVKKHLKSQKHPEDSICRAIAISEMIAVQRLSRPEAFLLDPPDWAHVPSYARLDNAPDLKLPSKFKPLDLTALELKQLNVFFQQNDPATSALFAEFEADRKAQRNGDEFAAWRPAR